MEIVPTSFAGSWRRKRRYQRLAGKPSKTVTFGGKTRRFWKIKAVPRLRLKNASPIRLWMKLKNAYIDMMLRLAGREQSVLLGCKRIGAGKVPKGSGMDEFQRRLIYEISKNLIASRELGTM